ncbi:tyrosine-type recombinase/integrase [Williamsia muralis]
MTQKTRLKILLAAFAGLRVHEIAKVKGEDVDRVTQTLTVKGKGGHTYTVPLHPVIMEASKHYPDRGYWFPRCTRGIGIDKSRPMGGKAVSDVIGRTMRRAGIPGTPHGLRHFFATELVKADVDLRTVQELLRHSSLQTTQIYVAVPDQRRRAAVGRLELPTMLAAAQ